MPYRILQLKEQVINERGAEGKSAIPDNYNVISSRRQFLELRKAAALMSVTRYHFDETTCAKK